VKPWALFLVLMLAAGSAAAQQRERGDFKGRPPQGMSKDERQRLRQDMREVYGDRDRDRGPRPERPRQMSPEEREKLRQDIQDANRDLRR
jgi:hypothetical protein